MVDNYLSVTGEPTAKFLAKSAKRSQYFSIGTPARRTHVKRVVFKIGKATAVLRLWRFLCHRLQPPSGKATAEGEADRPLASSDGP